MYNFDMAKYIERAKKKRNKEDERFSNYTFRLEIEIMDKFKDKCKRQGISMTEVLREMILEELSSK